MFGTLVVGQGYANILADVAEPGDTAKLAGGDYAAGWDTRILSPPQYLVLEKLIVAAVLQGAIGVDAGLMGEDIEPYPGLVYGDGDAKRIGDIFGQLVGHCEIEGVGDPGQT